MPITHKFSSAKPDSSDPSLIRASNWNDTHAAPDFCVPFFYSDINIVNNVWGNMPAALTEFGAGGANTAGAFRTKVDLSAVTAARLVVNVMTAGFSTAEIRAQYSTDQVTWNYLDHVSAPGVSISSTGAKVSEWVNINAAAKGDVFLRIVGINGNGVADPVFGNIMMQVR